MGDMIGEALQMIIGLAMISGIWLLIHPPSYIMVAMTILGLFTN